MCVCVCCKCKLGIYRGCPRGCLRVSVSVCVCTLLQPEKLQHCRTLPSARYIAQLPIEQWWWWCCCLLPLLLPLLLLVVVGTGYRAIGYRAIDARRARPHPPLLEHYLWLVQNRRLLKNGLMVSSCKFIIAH